jgi:hypothetical protein
MAAISRGLSASDAPGELSVAAMSMGAGGVASGQVVTFEFTGVVTELNINGGLFGPRRALTRAIRSAGVFLIRWGASECESAARRGAAEADACIAFNACVAA